MCLRRSAHTDFYHVAGMAKRLTGAVAHICSDKMKTDSGIWTCSQIEDENVKVEVAGARNIEFSSN